MRNHFNISIKAFCLFTLLTGLIYPLFITGMAQVFFPYRANGSIIIRNGNEIGSELIGQKFDSRQYFWSRPSSIDYNPLPSGGTNLGLTSDQLVRQVANRLERFRYEHALSDSIQIPPEMVFASGSGLDPHISPEAAMLQVNRISRVRNFNAVQKNQLVERIKKLTESPQFHLLGEPRINVFLLNLELDSIQ
jgi:K+-transporting ATPase ATPase C chain